MKKLFIALFMIGFIFIITGCSWFDKEAPTINFKNGDTVKLEYGEKYDDSDVIINDNRKGELEIKATGEINYQKTGEYTLTYTATDKAGNITSKERILVIQDTTSPEIKLNGRKEEVTGYGETYKEKGGSVSDNYDKDVKLITVGNVDTKRPGEYKIEYKATDSSGNERTITRTVKVVDLKAPDIKLKGDERVIIKFGNEYIEPGYTTEDDLDTEVEVKVNNPVNIFKAGEYEIEYIAIDDANNKTTLTRTVTVEPYIINKNKVITKFNEIAWKSEDMNGGEFMYISLDITNNKKVKLEIPPMFDFREKKLKYHTFNSKVWYIFDSDDYLEPGESTNVNITLGYDGNIDDVTGITKISFEYPVNGEVYDFNNTANIQISD
jgi:hypothetical protein